MLLARSRRVGAPAHPHAGEREPDDAARERRPAPVLHAERRLLVHRFGNRAGRRDAASTKRRWPATRRVQPAATVPRRSRPRCARPCAAASRSNRTCAADSTRRNSICIFSPSFRSTKDGDMSLEALLRWRHPRLGVLAPAAFIQVAIDSGVMLELGRRVLGAACSCAGETSRAEGARADRDDRQHVGARSAAAGNRRSHSDGNDAQRCAVARPDHRDHRDRVHGRSGPRRGRHCRDTRARREHQPR